MRSGAVVAALLAAGAAAGCCGTPRPVQGRNRDTPAAAFDFVRAAFAEDNIQEQYLSLHDEFSDRQGITFTKYALARDLRPGLFRRAADLLGTATMDEVLPLPAVMTKGGPRRAVKVLLTTAKGGRGVFTLVDEPSFLLATSDEDFPVIPGRVPQIDRAVRVQDGMLEVAFSARLADSPAVGAEVRRVEIRHEWLLYDIESLEGFDEFLRDVSATAEETKAKGEGSKE